MENMKLFLSIKKNFKLLHFKPNSADSVFALVRDHWTDFLESILLIVSLIVYLLCEAKTNNEFIYSAFCITVSLAIFLDIVNTVLKTSALFKFMDDAEAVFTKSKRTEPFV